MSRMAFRVAAAFLAVGICAVDILTPLEGAVAVLYVVVVLLAAKTARRSDIVMAAAIGITLTLLAYVISHGVNHVGSPTLRALVSLAAIGITALLALQHQAVAETLAAQARLLNLSHDMIFVRDRNGVITFWNRAAEEAYGWSNEEAIGQVADQLLWTSYPSSRATIEAELIECHRWDGALEQHTKAGAVLRVESRWAVQHDHAGRLIGVMETHTDVTNHRAAYAALVQSEKRYRRMFDASRIGVVQEDWGPIRTQLEALGINDALSLEQQLAAHPDFIRHARKLAKIIDVNPAFLAMVGAGNSLEFIRSADDVLVESDRTFAGALAAFVQGESFHEGQTELIRIDRHRIPVLFAITFPSCDDGDSNVLVFVVDITERKQAQDALLAAQAELAHAARVATLGELTASIAHEVNQPLMAVVTNGEAARRWLRRDPPNIDEVEAAIDRVVSQGRRASEIVNRIRAFLKKAPGHKTGLSVSGLVEEAALLVQHELTRERVELYVEIEPDLPDILGDRIQLQQLLVNLLVNAGQAMADQAGQRVLCVNAMRVDADALLITVSDTGPGISLDNLPHLFDPFFTTKQHGMGMGLAICRTTAEAHGGRLSVESAPGEGAVFRLTLPVMQECTAA